jgi:hypothetical protein
VCPTEANDREIIGDLNACRDAAKRREVLRRVAMAGVEWSVLIAELIERLYV